MSTKTQLINSFIEHDLNRSVGIEKNVLISDEIDSSSDLTVIKSDNKNAYSLRQILHRKKKASRYKLGDLSL